MISGIWQRIRMWLKARPWRTAKAPQPQVYVDYRNVKPETGKISCESQMRSSTGPMTRNTRKR